MNILSMISCFVLRGRIEVTPQSVSPIPCSRARRVILVARVGVMIENVCTTNGTRMRLRLEELSVVAFSTVSPVLLRSVRRRGTMAYSAPTAQQYAALAGVPASTRLRRSALLGAVLPSVAYIMPTVRARTLCPDRAPAVPTRLDVFSALPPGPRFVKRW
jgi:hypothetical protein